jgi:hypothetical protein
VVQRRALHMARALLALPSILREQGRPRVSHYPIFWPFVGLSSGLVCRGLSEGGIVAMANWPGFAREAAALVAVKSRWLS